MKPILTIPFNGVDFLIGVKFVIPKSKDKLGLFKS